VPTPAIAGSPVPTAVVAGTPSPAVAIRIPGLAPGSSLVATMPAPAAGTGSTSAAMVASEQRAQTPLAAVIDEANNRSARSVAGTSATIADNLSGRQVAAAGMPAATPAPLRSEIAAVAQDSASARTLAIDSMPVLQLPDRPTWSFTLPQERFGLDLAGGQLQLRAEAIASDGSAKPLPDWLRFDTRTGVFNGVRPAGATQPVVIRVTARDGEAREASTTFSLKPRADLPADNQGSPQKQAINKSTLSNGAKSADKAVSNVKPAVSRNAAALQAAGENGDKAKAGEGSSGHGGKVVGRIVPAAGRNVADAALQDLPAYADALSAQLARVAQADTGSSDAIVRALFKAEAERNGTTYK
jgi:hypothetical protein